MGNPILFDIKGGLARATLNRPEARNAITVPMLEDLHGFLRRIEADDTVRCVLITGAGDHFTAGGDVKDFREVVDDTPGARQADFEARVRRVNPVFLALDRIAQPVIAAVRGHVAGSGVSLVAGADLAIASQTARFMLAHIHLGMSPDAGASHTLVRALGPRRAKQIALLGDTVGADEALEMGLVNWVVEDADLDACAEDLAARIAAGPQLALQECKALLNAASLNSYEDQLELEALAFGRCAAAPAFVEGALAFAEKRKPKFN
jgi:2-(1,2-epoxy-1,2-dihydrophenyl)acetyl-CoA isomerase